MKDQTKGVLASLCGYSIFGFSFIFSKQALQVTTPVTLLFWRFTCAFAALALLALLRVIRLELRGKTLRRVLLTGLMNPILYFTCENYGLLYSSATFSGVMVALIPIAALALGALLLHERVTAFQTVCSVISVLGVVLISLSSEDSGQVTLPGTLLLIGAVLSSTGYALCSRRCSEEYSAAERTFVMFAMGCAFFLLLALWENAGNYSALIAPWRDRGFVWAVIYLGLVSSVGAFLCLNISFTYLPASRSTLFSNITTIISVFAGVLFAGESFAPTLMIPAALMVIGGVWGAQRAAE